MTTPVHTTDTSNAEAIAKNLAETCRPTVSDVTVHESWQRDYDARLERACAQLPDDIRFTVMAALIANGTMSDPDACDDLHIPGTCSHGLDADTCPCGCFEG